MLLFRGCHIRVFLTPWAAARQGSLSSTVSQSLPKLTSIEWVMPYSLFILCHHLLLLPWIFPSIRCYGCPNTCSKSQAAYGFRGRGEPCSLSGASRVQSRAGDNYGSLASVVRAQTVRKASAQPGKGYGSLVAQPWSVLKW